MARLGLKLRRILSVPDDARFNATFIASPSLLWQISDMRKNLSREELLQRIWIDPARCGGKPCIRGHRIWVSLILDLLASGCPTTAILDDYPGLVEEDIFACIAYGAEMSRERYVDIPLEART
jgi:uncharacterized protein (DUF433 family)